MQLRYDFMKNPTGWKFPAEPARSAEVYAVGASVVSDSKTVSTLSTRQANRTQAPRTNKQTSLIYGRNGLQIIGRVRDFERKLFFAIIPD